MHGDDRLNCRGTDCSTRSEATAREHQIIPCRRHDDFQGDESFVPDKKGIPHLCFIGVGYQDGHAIIVKLLEVLLMDEDAVFYSKDCHIYSKSFS